MKTGFIVNSSCNPNLALKKRNPFKTLGCTLNNEQSLAQKKTYIKKTLMKYYQSRSFFIANEHFPLVCNKF